MENTRILKAMADDTRLKILELLLAHNYCVRALARKTEISEAAVSQHLKVLKEAGVLTGEKRGYFVHYSVDRSALLSLASELEKMAKIKCKACDPKVGGCSGEDGVKCHNVKEASKPKSKRCRCDEKAEIEKSIKVVQKKTDK